jgi:5-methylcytosine-specific restriction enzyme A
MRNPTWKRDELILALELYFKYPPQTVSQSHPEVVALSQLLNQFDIHPERSGLSKFRNPNGVYMKMCNFLRFDDNYEGVGLKAGGKLEEAIWQEFAKNKIYLAQTSEAIRSAALSLSGLETANDMEFEFNEGRLLTKLHVYRERSSLAVKKKKEAVLEATGQLACESCVFDFFDFYGQLGFGFAECHHIIPVSQLRSGQRTKLSDLSILCANCHRMVHRSRPIMSVGDLRNLIINSRSNA